jgi:hypothetical protein
MRQYPSDIAFTPAVRSIQTAKGSRASYAKVERRGWPNRVTQDLADQRPLDRRYGVSCATGVPTLTKVTVNGACGLCKRKNEVLSELMQEDTHRLKKSLWAEKTEILVYRFLPWFVRREV